MIPSILSTGQIMFTCFHRISPCQLPFSTVIRYIDAAVNFDTFELVIVLVMVSNEEFRLGDE